MGTSHYKSDLQGKDGTETITNFATIGDVSTAIVGSTINGTVLTGSTGVVGTSYVKVGTVYIMSGVVQTNSSASIVAAAQALVGGTITKGSMFLNASPGAIWSFTATMTAATVVA